MLFEKNKNKDDLAFKFLEAIKEEAEEIPKEEPKQEVKESVKENNIEQIEKPSLFIHIDDYEELNNLLTEMQKYLEELKKLLNSYNQLHEEETKLLEEWGNKIDDSKERIAKILEILQVKAF
ncbi:NEQ121 [Nanoarchaeum equitans Kin4-M]|uniref:NEQ121 n=1 Tax=Nanoarchaeum equitans (strain Kin4-M) TaxID=228908 RepID=Q74N93_NANEQ|nr:NEQ121 [Nanoarchaeum equitans Kin4-M]